MFSTSAGRVYKTEQTIHVGDIYHDKYRQRVEVFALLRDARVYDNFGKPHEYTYFVGIPLAAKAAAN